VKKNRVWSVLLKDRAHHAVGVFHIVAATPRKARKIALQSCLWSPVINLSEIVDLGPSTKTDKPSIES
jgi:hypothetical protein